MLLLQARLATAVRQTAMEWFKRSKQQAANAIRTLTVISWCETSGSTHNQPETSELLRYETTRKPPVPQVDILKCTHSDSKTLQITSNSIGIMKFGAFRRVEKRA